MPGSLLFDAFAHHTWATMRLIDACTELDGEQLRPPVAGTYGSILETMRHLADGDAGYLRDITGGSEPHVDVWRMNLHELRSVMAADGEAWSRLLAGDPDPERVVTEVDDDDGFERDAPVGLRLAQAVHHGTDHRSQICTILTSLGIEPPAIDVWDFARQQGRISETVRAT